VCRPLWSTTQPVSTSSSVKHPYLLITLGMHQGRRQCNWVATIFQEKARVLFNRVLVTVMSTDTGGPSPSLQCSQCSQGVIVDGL
jgi:hypothetical protein